MKKLFTTALCLLLALSLFACKSTPSAVGLSAAQLRALAEEEVQYAGTTGTMYDIYRFNSLQDIAIFDETALIIYAEVVNAEVIGDFSERGISTDNYPRARTTVSTIASMKGGAAVGDTFVINEWSGDEYVFGGIPFMTVGNRYILFLSQDFDGLRGIIGAFGRFIEKQGYMFQQTAEEWRIPTYSPLTTEQFIAQVSTYVN
ncbi:MAG: hypothetical protein LBN02_10445 [Oscillospiraceae bacterium]|jgi:hypothetical protein|nr:hypothetical protein [Oscillospiraceae bacterium]